MLTIARVLITIAAFQYSVVPLIVDLSPSHVFHADWPPHARFHMVWLLSLASGIAIWVLWLTWQKSRIDHRYLKMACVPGFIVLGSFFAATLLMSTYGGALADPEHQVMIFGLDGNLVSFSVALAFQTMGTGIALSRTLSSRT